MQLNGAMNDIDWNAILNNVTNALPAVATTYLGYKSIQAQADAAAAARAAPNYGLPLAGNYGYSVTGPGAYPGVYSSAPKTGMDTTTMLLLAGAAGLVLLLLLSPGGK